MREAGGDEAVKRLAHVELHQPGILHDLLDVAGAVEQRQDPLLLAGQRHARLPDVRRVRREDEVEARNLLLDDAPLVHPAGALQQQHLGIDAEAGLALRQQRWTRS